MCVPWLNHHTYHSPSNLICIAYIFSSISSSKSSEQMEPSKKPHAICIPVPAQGHINPMLKLAKLLHFRGFHITFVHTEFNYKRSLNSQASNSLQESEDFHFETISDGLPPDNKRGILDLPAMCDSVPTHSLPSFRDLVIKLNNSSNNFNIPPVSCIISDGLMSFTLKVAEEFGIPEMLFFTPSACGMLGYLHFGDLLQRGYFPLKDESSLSDGYLDTVIDWIPGMEGIRLKDLPTFIRTTNLHDTMFNYKWETTKTAVKTKTIILNTFSELEDEVLQAIRTKIPNIYTIGPLHLLHQRLCDSNLSIESSLWKSDDKCLEWLDQKDPGSVVYVNFGSLVIMSAEQLCEFAWGLANSKCPFLWVIRSDLVEGASEVISKEFMEEIGERGLVIGWCSQEKVLSHSAVGGFLTHCGWNSALESISAGVPMICWPFFAEQQTNCFFACRKWGVGMEICSNVKREKVEGIVSEMVAGEKGKEMRERAEEWKKKAEQAISVGGSSYVSFDMLVKHLKHGRITSA